MRSRGQGDVRLAHVRDIRTDGGVMAGSPDTAGGAANDARRALAEIASCLRAHVERVAATGATGIPRGKLSVRSVVRPSAPASTPSRRSPEPATTSSVPELEPASAPAPVPELQGQEASDRWPAARCTTAEVAALHLPDISVPASRELCEQRLHVLATELSTCTKCPLCRQRTQTVFARGNPSAELCFVGEAPGADEDAQGEPFVGLAGQLLDRMIAAMGFAREQVYICNIVKCRPPGNRKPEPREMHACAPFLAEQLRLASPKVMVTLGTTALEGLLGAEGGIMRLRGHWRLYRGVIPVMPTFHPAYLLRNPAAKREVWLDLQAVLKHLGRHPPARPQG